jgi:1,4-alpha-glucan branching enzyme
LFSNDFDSSGFYWIDHHDQDNSVLSFVRRGAEDIADSDLVFIFNFTPVPRENYLMGLPESGPYKKVLDTDETQFGGSGYNTQEQIETIPQPWQNQHHRATVNLPPLGCLAFEKKR